MIIDGHIHAAGKPGKRKEFTRRLAAAGVDGGIVISLAPACFNFLGESVSHRERLDNVLSWCDSGPNLYPFYWIDPLERDATEQVAVAVDAGIMGFKVICDHFPPGDERAMEVYRSIAGSHRPILFHSGILWDGRASSNFNRPAGFEALLEVKGLTFSLAHISWPWCDELIAVYGKFLNAGTRRSELSVEMFVDITPGTPPIYRREALTKLYTVGYDVQNNVIFGSDCSTDEYGSVWTRDWIDRDTAILKKLKLGRDAIRKLYEDNVKRFLGLPSRPVEKTRPRPAQ